MFKKSFQKRHSFGSLAKKGSASSILNYTKSSVIISEKSNENIITDNINRADNKKMLDITPKININNNVPLSDEERICSSAEISPVPTPPKMDSPLTKFRSFTRSFNAARRRSSTGSVPLIDEKLITSLLANSLNTSPQVSQNDLEDKKNDKGLSSNKTEEKGTSVEPLTVEPKDAYIVNSPDSKFLTKPKSSKESLTGSPLKLNRTLKTQKSKSERSETTSMNTLDKTSSKTLPRKMSDLSIYSKKNESFTAVKDKDGVSLRACSIIEADEGI